MKFALEIINAISFIECIAIYSQNLLQNYIQKCSLMKRINFNSYFIVQNTSYEKSKNPIHSSIKRVLAEIIQQRHLQYKYCPTTFDADCTFGIKWCSRTLLIGRTSYSSFRRRPKMSSRGSAQRWESWSLSDDYVIDSALLPSSTLLPFSHFCAELSTCKCRMFFKQIGFSSWHILKLSILCLKRGLLWKSF